MYARAFVCVVSDDYRLTALRRRNFEPLAVINCKSSAAERAALRNKLHTFCPAGGAKICAAFGTELLLQPGKCDSMSLNRQDCDIRSYDPIDGNVEVNEMSMVCVCVFISYCFLPQCTSVCANYLLGNTPPDMIPNLKM
jgi:hypothetical protein